MKYCIELFYDLLSASEASCALWRCWTELYMRGMHGISLIYLELIQKEVKSKKTSEKNKIQNLRPDFVQCQNSGVFLWYLYLEAIFHYFLGQHIQYYKCYLYQQSITFTFTVLENIKQYKKYFDALYISTTVINWILYKKFTMIRNPEMNNLSDKLSLNTILMVIQICT